jgi:hypothetical protein
MRDGEKIHIPALFLTANIIITIIIIIIIIGSTALGGPWPPLKVS